MKKEIHAIELSGINPANPAEFGVLMNRYSQLAEGLQEAFQFYSTLTREKEAFQNPAFAIERVGGKRRLEEIKWKLEQYKKECPFVEEIAEGLEYLFQRVKAEALVRWPTVRQAVEAEGRYVLAVDSDIWGHEQAARYHFTGR